MASYPSIKLTYFPIEGSAEKVRLALLLCGIPFEEEHVSFNEWPTLKPKTKYGQLPLMSIDGGAPVSQSEAMLRYVARLGGRLYPDDKALAIDESIGLVGDLNRAWMPAFYIAMKPEMFGYPEDYHKMPQGKFLIKHLRENFVDTILPQFLDYFRDLLGNHQFLIGDEPTIADCVLVPTLRHFTNGQLDHVPVTCLDDHPKIKEYIARFMELPEVKTHYEGKK